MSSAKSVTVTIDRPVTPALRRRAPIQIEVRRKDWEWALSESTTQEMPLGIVLGGMLRDQASELVRQSCSLERAASMLVNQAEGFKLVARRATEVRTD